MIHQSICFFTDDDNFTKEFLFLTMIKSTTFDFLTSLAANNDREWFQLHKQQHDNARENILEFTASIIDKLSKIDTTIPRELDPKSCVMRIYRDVRFSKDKVPYKTNFGIGISANGKNFNGPGYYLHIQPQQSFLAGGCWMPEADLLKAIRQEIDYNGQNFHKIIDLPTFKKYFGGLDTEFQLKKAPKGYPSDHPDIDYLKLKSFTVGYPLTQADLKKTDAIEQVINGFKEMHPFIVFLRSALA